MNSARSKLENKDIEELYTKNRIKCISVLVILSVVLLLTILLSLRAGSYDTPIVELVKGIFGVSSDRRINLVVQNTAQLFIVDTAILVHGGDDGNAGAGKQCFLHDENLLKRVCCLFLCIW